MTMLVAAGGGGGGCEPLVTVTLSNVDLFSVLAATLQTTRPATALVPMLSVVLPTVVHVLPSADTAPVTVLPLRVRRIHAGGVLNAVARNVVSAPALDRIMNSRSPVGRTSRMTWAALAAVDSRIITPAFANVFVFCMLVSRAAIV